MPADDCGFGPPCGSVARTETGGGEGSFLHRDAAATFSLTCRYSRSPGLEKRKLAPMLVIGSPEGPRVSMTWVACAQTRPFSSVRVKTMRDAAHSKRHRRDIRRSQKLPDQTVSLACFGHVLGGYVGSLGSSSPRSKRLVIEIRLIKF